MSWRYSKKEESPYSAYYRIPRDSDDLLLRSKLIELATVRGATLVILIKEIGTDALFALNRVLARGRDARGLDRLDAYYRESVADGILRSRSLKPMLKETAASDPVSRSLILTCGVQVVEERSDGIIVRGG